MAAGWMVLAVLLDVILGSDASLCYYGYYSYYNRYFNYYYISYYCSAGCCGYYYDRKCCNSAGTIAGSVVGALVCIGVIVGVVICCWMNKKRGQRGVVVTHQGGQPRTTVAVVHSNQPGYAAPQPYGQQVYYQPQMYGAQYNPAYPPPPGATGSFPPPPAYPGPMTAPPAGPIGTAPMQPAYIPNVPMKS